MKTCPNCEGKCVRNWEGDGEGCHPCRMCGGNGSILEPSDAGWLASGFYSGDGQWRASESCDAKLGDMLVFSLPDVMMLVAGAASVPGRLSKEAMREKGMLAAWRGVEVQPRERP